MGRYSVKCGRCECPVRYSCRIYDLFSGGDFMVRIKSKDGFKCKNQVALTEPLPEIKLSLVHDENAVHYLKLGAGVVCACGININTSKVKYSFGKKEITCEKCVSIIKIIKKEKYEKSISPIIDVSSNDMFCAEKVESDTDSRIAVTEIRS